jgi:hypothetical protein
MLRSLSARPLALVFNHGAFVLAAAAKKRCAAGALFSSREYKHPNRSYDEATQNSDERVGRLLYLSISILGRHSLG